MYLPPLTDKDHGAFYLLLQDELMWHNHLCYARRLWQPIVCAQAEHCLADLCIILALWHKLKKLRHVRFS